MRAQEAETIALKAVEWLIGNDELLPVFMGATGVGQDDLRHGIGDPDFLGSVLDFILMDDAWIQQFSGQMDLAPDLPMQARQSLPGGAQIHWT